MFLINIWNALGNLLRSIIIITILAFGYLIFSADSSLSKSPSDLTEEDVLIELQNNVRQNEVVLNQVTHDMEELDLPDSYLQYIDNLKEANSLVYKYLAVNLK